MPPDSTDTFFLLFKEFCNSASQTVQCSKHHRISKYAGKSPPTKALWHNPVQLYKLERTMPVSPLQTGHQKPIKPP